MQAALAIQNTCSHTAVSATQITCCTQHLLAIHGIQQIQIDHEADGLGQYPLVVTPVLAPWGSPSAACGYSGSRQPRARGNLPDREQDFQTPGNACTMGRAQHAGSQHRSNIHSITHPQASLIPQSTRPHSAIARRQAWPQVPAWQREHG